MGAIAYELFAYKRPFDGDSLTAVMYKIMHDRPDPTALPSTAYSPGLERIIMKALARPAGGALPVAGGDARRPGGLVRDTVSRLDPQAPAPGADDQADTLALQVDVEMEKRRVILKSLLHEARQALAAGDLARAREQASHGLDLFPDDADAKAVISEVDAEALKRRVDRELTELRGEIDGARNAGQLQRALSLCKRVLEFNPEDVGVARVAAEIESEVHDRQVEELAEQARSYAASGDVELAQKIAGRIEKLAPGSPRYRELKELLDFQSGRQRVMDLTKQSQEHIAQGNLVEALAAAEAALALDGTYALAREIRERTAEILARQEASKTSPGLAPPPPRSGPDAVRPAPAKAAAAPKSQPPPARPQFPAPKSQPPRPAPASGGDGPARPAARPAGPPKSAPDVRPAPAAVAPAPAAVAPAPAPVAASAPAMATPVPTPSAPTRAAPPPPAAAVAAAPIPEPAPAAKAPSSAAPPAPPPAAAASSAQQPVPLTPLPEGVPVDPEAARLLDIARRMLRDRAPQKALPNLEQAAALEPTHAGIERLLNLTRVEARKAEAESLTSAALNHFLQNNYKKAKLAVEKALALEPENKKAKELINILGSLS